MSYTAAVKYITKSKTFVMKSRDADDHEKTLINSFRGLTRRRILNLKIIPPNATESTSCAVAFCHEHFRKIPPESEEH